MCIDTLVTHTGSYHSCRLALDEMETDQSQNSGLSGREGTVETVPEVITMPSRFEKVQDKGFIDVWWLYDDGGT